MDGSLIEKSPVLTATLTLNDDLAKLLRRNVGEVAAAQALTIDCPEAAELASSELARISKSKNHIKKVFDGFVEPAKKIIENARTFFNPAQQALDEAESIIKGKLADWIAEQRRIADEQRLAYEAEERAARQRAEQDAAKARARAEEEAREQQRRAVAAEQQRQQAFADGNHRAAAAAAAAAAEATEKAQAALENGEAKATTVQVSAIASVQAPAPVATKVAGFTMKDNWVAETIKEGDAAVRDAQIAICKAIAEGRNELLVLVPIDWSAANKLAKAMKGEMNVPGLRAVNKQVASRTRSAA